MVILVGDTKLAPLILFIFYIFDFFPYTDPIRISFLSPGCGSLKVLLCNRMGSSVFFSFFFVIKKTGFFFFREILSIHFTTIIICLYYFFCNLHPQNITCDEKMSRSLFLSPKNVVIKKITKKCGDKKK